MKTIEKVNAIALSSLFPGPAAFWHRHMWDKIHDVFYAHNKKGIPTKEDTPNMIIDEVYKYLDGFWGCE